MTARTTHTVRARVLRLAAEAPLSLAIAAACLVAFAWTEAHGPSTDAATLVRFGALERGRVWSGEPWRMLTAPFLHSGWLHLSCNVVFGVLACRVVERALGGRRFLAVWLTSALAGSALSLLGQDVTSVGASGAMFGMLGAALALHLRAVGSWRAFLASRPARRVVATVLGFEILAGLLLPVDHLAHLGGLAAGAAAAWLATRAAGVGPLAWAAFGAVLLAAAAAAAWPRATLTRFESSEVEAALRARDPAAARSALARAASRGDAEPVRYDRARVLVQEGDLDGALRIARTLRGSDDPRLRAGAAALGRDAAKVLGYRHYTGDGAPRDPWLALAYMEEACALGDRESCENARRIAGP